MTNPKPTNTKQELREKVVKYLSGEFWIGSEDNQSEYYINPQIIESSANDIVDIFSDVVQSQVNKALDAVTNYEKPPVR